MPTSLILAIAAAMILSGCGTTSTDRLEGRLENRDARLDNRLERVDARDEARQGRWEAREGRADASAEDRWERLTQ